jgi:class 3 adenylate cyclase/tetratricopeptide (TPR) repeat protein
MTCPVCGTVTVPAARFCHHCGAALPTADGLPTAERRTVTVLFGDLSDFTAWAESVDPERVGAVTDRALAALAGAVKTFGGHVDKLTGDGIMAVFGAPVAHEDDPERAVRAALAMQRAVRRVLDDERGGGVPAGLRIGVNTGEVVAGVQAALEYTVIGDTVNTAARLSDAAGVGAVYAGAATQTATRRVASWRRLLPLRLKGKRQAVEAYELLGPVDAPGTRSGLGDEGPFVGRETEVALVRSRLGEAAGRAETRVLVFTAEAGLGKTRLAAEVARIAASFDGASARVLSVRCAAYGERWRLGPLADLVRVAIGLPESGAIATRTVVEERLRRFGALRHGTAEPSGSAITSPVQVEQLLALLGYAESPNRRDPAVDGGRESGADTASVAVADLLSALAAQTPLVVVVDDLHDASPQTVDALGSTLNRLVGPVLVILLGRPEMVRTAGALTRLADAEVRALPALRGADTERLLLAYLNGGRLGREETGRLLATAQGNPFYLAELVTLLMERGNLVCDETGQWSLAPQSLQGQLLSRDLAMVLAARIDALSAQSRAILRDAAVVGDTVPAAALAVVRAADPALLADSTLPSDETLSAGTSLPAGATLPADAKFFGSPGASGADRAGLAIPAASAGAGHHPVGRERERLERNRLERDRLERDLLERDMEELFARRMLLRARGGYTFATPLMREAAYAGVGKADLAERHARLVNWAAGLSLPVPSLGWTPDALDAFIADHAERAATLADDVSLRIDAPARSSAPAGVAALGRLAARAIRAGEPGQAAQLAERAAALAGGVMELADRLVHASAMIQLGRAVAALADTDQILVARELDPASEARALLLAGRARRMLGDAELADAALLDALAVASAADLPLERAEVLRRIGMADYQRGRLAKAGEAFQEALRISEAGNDRRGQAWAMQNLAWLATTVGDFAAADATLAQAARLFADLEDAPGRAWVRGTTAFTRLLAGRFDEARRLAAAFLPFGERVGERWAVGTLRAVEAFAAAELGDLTAADRDARRAFRDFDAIDDDWGRALALVVRGVVARGLGATSHAADLLAEAGRFGERRGHPLLVAIAGTIRGFVLLELGDLDAAEKDGQAVLSVLDVCDLAPSARIGPQVLLGRVALAKGDTNTALDLLGAVLSTPEHEHAVLLPRREAAAAYAEALLAAGRVDESVRVARGSAQAGEDVRSRVLVGLVLAQALASRACATSIEEDSGEVRAIAADDDRDQARAIAAEAVRVAYETQWVGERARADAVLATLSDVAEGVEALRSVTSGGIGSHG